MKCEGREVDGDLGDNTASRYRQLDCKIVMTCFFAPNPALAPVLVFSHITRRGARTLPGQGIVGCCANESCGCEV